MSRQLREFWCGVVSESVRIRLRKKSVGGINGEQVFFVQCDQSDCQYVDENKLPCPLNPSLFAEEIEEREESSRHLRGESWDE